MIIQIQQLLDGAQRNLSRTFYALIGDQITIEQAILLSYMVEAGPVSQADICRIFDKDKGNVCRVIQRMLRKGWIEKVRSTSGCHGLNKMILVTESGETLIGNVQLILKEKTPDLWRNASPLITVLTQFQSKQS